ncbi:MAG TPA: sugar phosphate isomerase/epimerase family protein [Acidobacteriota bacterium]|nr:sugar phosphate isomerase/epimerase family protein [Acidobacteriota bacterium]
MARPVTLFTGQWADLSFQTICKKAKQFGYDGVELACWGDHFDVERALQEDAYCQSRWDVLNEFGLSCHAVSNHLVGQAVCDNIDSRHKSILPPRVWGDGDPDGVRSRAAEEMKNTARAAQKFGVTVVNGFTGSGIWHLLYSFPPVEPAAIDRGYHAFGACWRPILDLFQEVQVKFGLEVHPTEIAFDISSAQRALDAVDNHPSFGFNYDPSHFGYQGVDYIEFIRTFRDRIFHVHMKDVYWADQPRRAGVFGGHLSFGHPDRFWDFRSLGRGSIRFEEVIRALNEIGYEGPLSVEWEDAGMDREHGATEAAAFVRRLDFKPSAVAFDAAFERKD